MITLGIETATAICSIGLAHDQTVLAIESEDAGRRHSVVLVDMIERVLTDACLERDAVQGVAVSAGPGSFTGLRIGMALVKGICLANEIPLAVVSTLHALAVASGSESDEICACLDARHEALYSGIYKRSRAGLVTAQADASRPIDELVDVLGSDTVVVGYGVEDYETRFLGAGHTVFPSVIPSGASVALVGEQKLLADESTRVDVAEPNYCKKSQAEQLRAGEKG